MPLEFLNYLLCVVAKIEQDLTLGWYIIGLKPERGFMSALTKAIYCLHSQCTIETKADTSLMFS